MAEPLIGPQANLTGKSEDPSVIGGQGPTAVYEPIDEAARQAIFGVNPKTGKAYTDAESARLNGGFNPWAGATGYKLESTGQITILKSDGTAMTTGATYKPTSQGYFVPSDEYMQNFNLQREEAGQEPVYFDEFGRETTDPSKAVTSGNIKNVNNSAAFVAGNANVNQSGNKNPFVPGSAAATAWDERKSAYDLLYTQFKQYGLESLIAPLQNLITEGVPASEFTIRLRETEAYKKRFAANAQRIAKGLAAISEAEYLGLEDQYQNIMRNYGLPAEYYTRGDMGIQSGFEKFIANDVSAAELEDRVMTAQSRVMNANPEVLASLKAFYPDITNGDILAYTLDPTKGLTDIKRKVTAAEIGGAAIQAGLKTGMTRAEELAAAGITKAQAQQGFQTVAEVAPRGGVLSEIYKQSPYTQTTAEAEVFGLAGSVDAARQRKKLTQLETAAFSGSAGAGAIARDRAGVL